MRNQIIGNRMLFLVVGVSSSCVVYGIWQAGLENFSNGLMGGGYALLKITIHVLNLIIGEVGTLLIFSFFAFFMFYRAFIKKN